MFGRAAITLGIGPHSSLVLLFSETCLTRAAVAGEFKTIMQIVCRLLQFLLLFHFCFARNVIFICHPFDYVLFKFILC